MFWFRVLAVAQIALLIRRHLQRLEPDERARLASLVKKSKGRPRTNLSANEREEMLRIVPSSALPNSAAAPSPTFAALAASAERARSAATLTPWHSSV